jgi:hypothetical protein
MANYPMNDSGKANHSLVFWPKMKDVFTRLKKQFLLPSLDPTSLLSRRFDGFSFNSDFVFA